MFDFLDAELHSWGIRSKGKNAISKSQEWWYGLEYVEEQHTIVFVPIDSVEIYMAEHVSRKSRNAGFLPWHSSLGTEGN